jgi:hypothetical protein
MTTPPKIMDILKWISEFWMIYNNPFLLFFEKQDSAVRLLVFDHSKLKVE